MAGRRAGAELTVDLEAQTIADGRPVGAVRDGPVRPPRLLTVSTRSRARCSTRPTSRPSRRASRRPSRRRRSERYAAAASPSPATSRFVRSRSSREELAQPLVGERPAIRLGELVEQLPLAVRVDERKPDLLLVTPERGDELEPRVDGVEDRAVELGDLVAESLDGRVSHGGPPQDRSRRRASDACARGARRASRARSRRGDGRRARRRSGSATAIWGMGRDTSWRRSIRCRANGSIARCSAPGWWSVTNENAVRHGFPFTSSRMWVATETKRVNASGWSPTSDGDHRQPVQPCGALARDRDLGGSPVLRDVRCRVGGRRGGDRGRLRHRGEQHAALVERHRVRVDGAHLRERHLLGADEEVADRAGRSRR